MAKFVKINVNDKDLSRVQDNVAQAFTDVATPLIQAIVLPNVVLAVGSNSINHTLGRKLLGWSIMRRRADASIHDTQDSNGTPDRTLTLVSSAAATVDLLVF